jgi:hypothetical protein
MSAEVPEAIEVRGHPLRCTICSHDRFWTRKAQLHTAGATFFNLEWAQPSADCFVCAECGYVHWFLPLG